MYYKFTITEDCTLLITYCDGALVSDLPNFEKDDANKTYAVTVKAGDVLVINLWTMRTTDAEYVYTISVATPAVEPEEGEGEGDGNGDNGGEAVACTTYIATHSSGRKMKVAVYDNGTLMIYRSDLTGSFTTTSALVETYSWEIQNGAFVITSTGTVSQYSFTAECVPTSVTWGTGTFTGFELFTE